MGTPTTDLEHAAVGLVSLGLVMEAFEAEGMQENEKCPRLQRSAREAEAFFGAKPSAYPEDVMEALKASPKFDERGQFNANRTVALSHASDLVIDANAAWSEYYF